MVPRPPENASTAFAMNLKANSRGASCRGYAALFVAGSGFIAAALVDDVAVGTDALLRLVAPPHGGLGVGLRGSFLGVDVEALGADEGAHLDGVAHFFSSMPAAARSAR